MHTDADSRGANKLQAYMLSAARERESRRDQGTRFFFRKKNYLLTFSFKLQTSNLYHNLSYMNLCELEIDLDNIIKNNNHDNIVRSISVNELI